MRGHTRSAVFIGKDRTDEAISSIGRTVSIRELRLFMQLRLFTQGVRIRRSNMRNPNSPSGSMKLFMHMELTEERVTRSRGKRGTGGRERSGKKRRARSTSMRDRRRRRSMSGT